MSEEKERLEKRAGMLEFHIPEGFEPIRKDGRAVMIPCMLDVRACVRAFCKQEEQVREARSRFGTSKELPGDKALLDSRKAFREHRNELVAFLREQESLLVYVILISRCKNGGSYQFAAIDSEGNARDYCCVSEKFLRDIPEEWMFEDENYTAAAVGSL